MKIEKKTGERDRGRERGRGTERHRREKEQAQEQRGKPEAYTCTLGLCMAEGGGQGRAGQTGPGHDRSCMGVPQEPRAPSPSHGSHGCRRISRSRISAFCFNFFLNKL
jgi:hypothetical protein